MTPGCKRSLRIPAKKATVGRFERLIVIKVWWNVISAKSVRTTVECIIDLEVAYCCMHIGPKSRCGLVSIQFNSEISRSYTKIVQLAAMAANIAPRVSSGSVTICKTLMGHSGALRTHEA